MGGDDDTRLQGRFRAVRHRGAARGRATSLHGMDAPAMTIGGFLLLLLIAAVAGALGQALAGYSLGGCLLAIVVGFVGAWIGTWIADSFGLPPLLVITIQGRDFPVVWATVGSALLAAVVGALTRRPRPA